MSALPGIRVSEVRQSFLPSAGAKEQKGGMSLWMELLVWMGISVAAAMMLVVVWIQTKPPGPRDGVVGGNHRIEAMENDVAMDLVGQADEVLVNEGGFVWAKPKGASPINELARSEPDRFAGGTRPPGWQTGFVGRRTPVREGDEPRPGLFRQLPVAR